MISEVSLWWYQEDHDELEGVLCSCGRFRLGEREAWESQCFHCFAAAAGLDACPVCVASLN
jgi:hypothetical protein